MPFKDLDWEGMDPPGPATESSRERGFVREPVDAELGRSNQPEDEHVDNAGDIADEGRGHRG